MSNEELCEQWKRCEEWKDADQWEILAVFYLAHGYILNAQACLDKANECRLLPGITEQDTDVRFVTVQA